MINESRPNSSIANATKVLGGETWDSNPNTWNEETRTLDESGTLWANEGKPTTTLTNTNKPS